MSIALRDDDAHPSRHRLLLHHLAEPAGAPDATPPPPWPAEAVAAHLAACPACSAVIGEIEAAGRAFHQAPVRRAEILAATSPAPLGALRLSSTPGWWSWLRSPQLAVSAATLALVLGIALLGPRLLDQAPQMIGERSKGGALQLGVLVAQEGRVLVAAPDRTYRQGDHIQLTLAAPREGFVVLLGLDGRGQATVYAPADDAAPLASAAIGPGAARPVGPGLVLDDAPARERIFALLCDQPLGHVQLQAALATWPGGASRLWTADAIAIEQLRSQTGLATLECLQTWLDLPKE